MQDFLGYLHLWFQKNLRTKVLVFKEDGICTSQNDSTLRCLHLSHSLGKCLSNSMITERAKHLFLEMYSDFRAQELLLRPPL